MIFSKRDIIAILIPIIIEQFLAVSVGIADSMMVASAGEAAVSGVSLVDSLNLLMIYIFTAFGAGGSVITSQYIGRQDITSAQKSAKELYVVSLFVALVIMAVCIAFCSGILNVIFGNLDSDVMSAARVYFFITALSYPFLAVTNGCGAIFRSMGNSKISMYSSTLMNIINIVGNAVLIYCFNMGAAGAATATLISRIIGAVLMTYLVKNRNNLVYIDSFLNYKPDFKIVKSILYIAVPNGVESSMFQLGKVITQSLIASFGTVAIAANAVGGSLSTFQYVSGTAVSIAMITIVGRCIGADEKEQAKKYTKMLMKIAYSCIIAISFLMTVFSEQIISIYNLSDEASFIAKDLMLYHSIAISTVWPMAFTLTNAFRASNDVQYPLVISMLSMWIFRVGFSYALGKYMELGVYGVWYAMFIDWAFRGVIYYIRFLRGTWLKKYEPSKM